jgi:hypothetical protein
MGGKQRVVLGDRCPQQRWPPTGDGELESRQHPRIIREQPVIASLYVSQGVGQQECVRILQSESRQ